MSRSTRRWPRTSATTKPRCCCVATVAKKPDTRAASLALELKLGAAFEPTPEMLNSAPVALPEPITTEFFELLLKAELGGDVSYSTWADNEPDPEVARLYRLNGREESLHAGRVEAVMALLATT